MNCKYCGSGRHISDVCPTLNLVRMINDLPYDENNMPDLVTALDLDDLLELNEEELRDQVKQINKIQKNGGS